MSVENVQRFKEILESDSSIRQEFASIEISRRLGVAPLIEIALRVGCEFSHKDVAAFNLIHAKEVGDEEMAMVAAIATSEYLVLLIFAALMGDDLVVAVNA